MLDIARKGAVVVRYLIIVFLLVGGLAAPGSAAASAALPVTPSPLSFGGVVGTGGSVSSTSVVIRVGSLTFADISCSGSTCTGTVAGIPNVTLTRTVSTSGAVTFSSSTFPTHGAWVKAVADWVVDNRSALPAGVTVGKIVSQAARIEGPLASGGQGGGGGHGRGRP